MNNYQLSINNKKIVGKRIFHTLALLFIVHCSLIIVNCRNPLIIHILGPKTVSFETNGGSRIEDQTVYRDYPIKRPSNPSRSGHTFESWYIDNETFLEQWEFDMIPTSDITLYAKWISGRGTDPGGDTLAVTFNANGGIPEPQPQDIDLGGTIAEPADPTLNYTATEGLYLNPVPTEYTLDGWFKDPALTEKWDFSSPVTGAMTLYAKWTVPNRIPGIGEYNNIISDAVTHVKNNANTGTYILLLKEISTGGYAGSQTINADNFNLTIEAIGPRTITYNGTADSFFTINNPTATLTLGKNFTLHGNTVNVSLITVTRGTLVMETGSTITGHNNTGVLINGGTFNMNGGIISENGRSALMGDGVYVSSGTFTMNGGTISKNGNTGSEGGGVAVTGSGIFIMNDGDITENSAPSGGGVHVSGGGTFTMNGGKIRKHGADNGGGVVVGSSGTFYMTDGTISENSANNGAGVNVGSSGIFNMSGGTISGNTANSTFYGGGGVYSKGTFNLSGGTISGNTAATSGGGVYVGSNGSFKISNGIVYGNDYNDLLNNIAAGAGAALYVDAQGTAQWLSGSNWSDIISGSDNSPKYSNDTINFLH